MKLPSRTKETRRRNRKMPWRTFRSKCKSRSRIDKCGIKVYYRYNADCERYDCPRRMEKESS